MPMVKWEREYIPQINAQMQRLGYNGNGTYSNGTLNVGDINPWNIGYNKNGTLRFFDADVYKSGGRIKSIKCIRKMKQVKVNIGNKSYICDLLESEEDRRKGLMGVENLP